MMTGSAQMKAQAAAMAEVQTFMHRFGLTVNDLIEIGGAELESKNPKTREKARRVERCWAMMARLHVCYAPSDTAKRARTRRGEGHFSEVVENKEVSTDEAREVKSLKNNDKTNNHSVAASETSEKGRWKHKRRLVSVPSEGAAS